MELPIENINTPDYWDEQYRKEVDTLKKRLDNQRLGKIRDALDKVKEIPGNPDEKVSDSEISLLDVGGGTGEVSRIMIYEHPGLKIHTIDFSPEAIAIAQDVLERLTYSLDDAQKLNTVPSNSQNVVFVGETLEHLDFDDDCVINVIRVLKVGGVAVFTTPYKDRNKSWEHVREYDLNDIRNLFSKYMRLKVLDLDLVGDYQNWFSIVITVQKVT